VKMEFPPPEMSMPPPNFQPQHNFHQPRWNNNQNFHHNKPFYKSYKHGMQIQDDFDGKRLRKSVMRKTVDYSSSIVKALEVRS
jgi:polyadenylation factor subunit 2